MPKCVTPSRTKEDVAKVSNCRLSSRTKVEVAKCATVIETEVKVVVEKEAEV